VFLKEVVPYSEKVKVRFALDPTMPELKNGVELVKNGDLLIAADTFRVACENYSAHPEVHKAWYNLGLVNMYSFQFPDAPEALRKASELSPNPLYVEAIAKCDTLEKNYIRIKKTNTIEK